MKIPYGYAKTENKEIMINEEQADVVKLIYNAYLQGKSLGGIVEILKANGILSPKGNLEWTRQAVDNILANSKYIAGIIIFEEFTAVQIEKRNRTNNKSKNNF